MYDEFHVPDVLIVLFYVHVKTVETKLSGGLILPGGGGVYSHTLPIRFNAFTSKLLYSCCTLCFGVQGGHILARTASADYAILDK